MQNNQKNKPMIKTNSNTDDLSLLPSIYDKELTPVWSSLGQLSERLKHKNDGARTTDKAAFDKVLAETRAHLTGGHVCIDWNRIAGTDVIPLLREAVGLPGLSFGGGWMVILFVVLGVVVGSIAGGLAGLSAGAIGVFLASMLLKKYRIDSLLPKIQTRLLTFVEYDKDTEHPYLYNCMLPDERALGLNSILLDYRFSNISRLGESKAIGIFGPDSSAVAFIPRSEPGGIFNVLGHAEMNLGSSFVGQNIEQYETRQAELLEQLAAIEGTLSVASLNIDIEESRRKWADVVVEPQTMEHILRSWLLFAYSDKSAPRGILLKGPPGTGKSLIASIFAESSGAHFFKLSVGALKGEHIGESGNNVRRIWEEARSNQPAIIFVDECEGIFVKRGSDQGDSFTNELVQTFLTEWDGIGPSSQVLVIGATNRADLIDDAVISRFTDVIELLPVGKEHRDSLILAVARQIGMTSKIPSEAIKEMGGLSGRDLRNVLQQALRLAAPDEPSAEHFMGALTKVRGKSSTKTDAGASWDSLVLEEETKKRLKIVCHMLKDAEALVASRIPVSRSLLLFGPPGTGKTQIARTIANEAGVSFIARTTADLKGQYLGHAASRIAQIFETARAQSPCILFIDEIDALTSSRQGNSEDQLQREALTQLLQELDGIADKGGFVLVIAATNCLNQIDDAILSRFNQKIEVGLPDIKQRIELLQVLLANRPVATGISLEALVEQSEGFSGRDLRELVAEAFNAAVGRTLTAGMSATETILEASDLNEVLARRNRFLVTQ